MKKNQSVREVAKIYYKLCKSTGTWIYVSGMIGASFLFYQARDPRIVLSKNDRLEIHSKTSIQSYYLTPNFIFDAVSLVGIFRISKELNMKSPI